MISYNVAVDKITAFAEEVVSTSLAIEELPLLKALDRVAAKDVRGPEGPEGTLPRWDNSAMDGICVNARHIASAQAKLAAAAGEDGESEVKIRSLGRVVAGDAPPTFTPNMWDYEDGDIVCYEIMTGAPVPKGNFFDSVIKIEDLGRTRLVRQIEEDVEPEQSIFTLPFTTHILQGQHIRRAGEDIPAGYLLLSKGTLITPGHIALLASFGILRVSVPRRPRIAIITTGKELTSTTSATPTTSSLAAGRIFDTNGPYLFSTLLSTHLLSASDITLLPSRNDSPEHFEELVLTHVLGSETKYDVVISTGAVSMGVHDFVPAAVRRLGFDVGFHHLGIKPGHPALFATLPKGERQGGVAFFALPGNPGAVGATERFLVRPYLRTLLGLPREGPTFATLLQPSHICKKVGTRNWLKARFVRSTSNDEGLGVEVLDKMQGSGMMRGLAEGDCYVELLEGAESVQSGQRVRCWRFGGEGV
ncbi:MoeA N-terminal region-like protein [Saitoella complicata NRRL Y-17804]|nr:MoeA N-terminal region-like protein [Saitoella complicata NRRL Y-17804]ODQ51801.1 MoeA N-terminal region-like protein [Saitoella complicata NRRL Y-17804]